MPIDEGLEFMQRCQNLFAQANLVQARMELKRFGRIVHFFTRTATELQVPLRAVLPLERAMAIASTEDHQLTAVHADYLQVCLLSRSYARAARVADFQHLKRRQEARGLHAVRLSALLVLWRAGVHWAQGLWARNRLLRGVLLGSRLGAQRAGAGGL
jgi:hypothetical protein